MFADALLLIAVPAIAGAPVPPSAPIPLPIANETRLTAYTTGYSYWDNTPPGSADISNGVIQTKAAYAADGAATSLRRCRTRRPTAIPVASTRR